MEGVGVERDRQARTEERRGRYSRRKSVSTKEERWHGRELGEAR